MLCDVLARFKQIEGDTLVKEQLIGSELKLIDTMSVENVRKLKGLIDRRRRTNERTNDFDFCLDKTSTDAYRLEYENSREKFQEYIRHFERVLKERKALKQNCEQAEIFYDAQYQDANIVVEVRREKRRFFCSINVCRFVGL